MVNQKLDTKYAYMEIDKGILMITYKMGVKVTLDVAKEIVNTRKQFTKGEAYPGLANDEGLVSIDKEARDYFSSQEGIEGVTAGAFLVSSVFSTFIANFILKVTSPPIPVRVFTDKSKAIKWLEQFKENIHDYLEKIPETFV